jgi:hypothetical protein
LSNVTWRNCDAINSFRCFIDPGVRGANVGFIGFGLPAFLIMMISAAGYIYVHKMSLVITALSRPSDHRGWGHATCLISRRLPEFWAGHLP